MRPDRRNWTTFRPTPPSDLRTAHVDFLLRFVLERSAGAMPRVSARLDALERALAELTKQWRAHAEIAPARELRMSDETLASLLAWLEAPGDAEPADIARLGVYASGALTDDAVPAGWLRVRFG
ncbi:MAG TPA: hypothetical protein VGP25_04155 [Gemmatimonadaceae bacterium]|nr:hypothetical protein [Gemmatimonadaceae bacterium]